MPRNRPLLALVAAAALAVGACSSGGEGGAGPTTTGAPSKALELELASSVRPSVTVEIPDEPVASAPAERSGMHLDVYALHRHGDSSLLLVLGLRNDTGGRLQIQRELEDRALESEVDYLASGVTLFDAENLKRHLVYLDDEGGCLCSLVGTKGVGDGETLFAAALFPAPPDDVESMVVQTPIGAVPGVQITDG